MAHEKTPDAANRQGRTVSVTMLDFELADLERHVANADTAIAAERDALADLEHDNSAAAHDRLAKAQAEADRAARTVHNMVKFILEHRDAQ